MAMRELNPSRNVLSVTDEVAGCTHELYYRMPTTAERMQYQAGLFQRRDNKIISKAYAQQIKFGAKVLTGFKPGTLGYDGVPLSSDAGSEGYREEWKTILETCAPELLVFVGRAAFESMSVQAAAQSAPVEMALADAEGNIVTEEAPDLGK